jgi:hypothetical protein
MDYFKINSKSLTRNPTSISQSKYKIQKTDRTIDGTLVADIIAVKNKVSFTWDYLTTADLKKLTDEVNGSSFPVVEYNDPDSGEMLNITGHAGEITYTPYYDVRTRGLLWKEVNVSFEER